MENFITTFTAVFIMFLYLIPGYLLMKFKHIDDKHIKTVSTILIYIFSPCMIIDSFISIERTKETLINLLLFAVITLIIQVLFIIILFLIFKRKFDDPKYRMFTVGSVCGNVGFFGIPLVKSVLSAYPIATAYASIYVFTMNVIVFTLGSFCITKDKKYISIKQAFLNPTSFSLIIALILFSFNFKFQGPNLVVKTGEAVSLLSKMTTPTCMIILGMRLATEPIKELVNKPIIYLNILSKQIIYPLCAYLLVYFLPIDYSFKAAILILSSVPCASVILNLAEMYGVNQEISANTVLLTTLSSIITIPLLLLIL